MHRCDGLQTNDHKILDVFILDIFTWLKPKHRAGIT